MTDLVEIPAMELPPRSLLWITDPKELLGQLRSGASLAQIPEAANATAEAEPTFRIVRFGQDQYRVSSRIAKGFIGDGTVSPIGTDDKGRLLYLITKKGRT